MTTTTPAISPTLTSFDSQQRLIQVRDLWKRSQKDQLEIGRLLYEERTERLSVGGTHARDGFHEWLRETGVPKSSAYRRIAEYEISIGERTEDDRYDKPAPTPSQVGTTIAEPADQPTAAPAADEPTPLESKPKQLHVAGDENAPLFWKTLGNKLNALLPTYSDGGEHIMVTMLEQAHTEPLSKDTTVLKSLVAMLKKISSDYAEHAQRLEARMKFEEIAEIVQVEEQMAPPSGGVSIPTSPLQYTEASC